MRGSAAALLVASLLTTTPPPAAGAPAPAAVAFERLSLSPPPPRGHARAWLALGTGAVLVAASFPLADRADRRYAAYLAETDPARLDARFDAVRRADRVALGALVTGEALLLTGAWLRFVRRAPESRLTVAAGPDRCALTLRF
jgi:hypothetical protein